MYLSLLFMCISSICLSLCVYQFIYLEICCSVPQTDHEVTV